MWIIAAAGQGMPNVVGSVVKTFLSIIIVIGVFSVLIETLKPARQARKHHRAQKKREMSREEARVILAGIGLLAFAVFEYWLWNYKGLGGRILAIAIPLGVVALGVVVVVKLQRRKTMVSSHKWRSDGSMHCPHDVASFQGQAGENMVREAIKSLPHDRYVVLHDVWLPMEDGGETQIDHVVVSAFGIFIIETKNWKGTIYADAKSVVWTKFNLGHKDTYKNPIHQNYKHLLAVREKFSRPGTEFVFGVVAMSPAANFKDGVPEGVVFYNELKGWILGHVTPCINPGQIADIVAALQEWSSTVPEESRRSHCGES